MNKVCFIGRLVADPELKQTGSGIAVTSFTLAVDRPYKQGENKITDWIDCVAWRKTAEFICKYFSKGDPIIIDGSLQTRMWEDQNNKKHKAVEVNVENVEFAPINKGAEKSAGNTAPLPVYPAANAEQFTVVDDEDLPF